MGIFPELRSQYENMRKLLTLAVSGSSAILGLGTTGQDKHAHSALGIDLSA